MAIQHLFFAAALALDPKAAERFANLALACVHKEYPNKISHNLNSDADVAPPRKLTPAFYGCYELAFVRARALAADASRAHVPRRAVREAGA